MEQNLIDYKDRDEYEDNELGVFDIICLLVFHQRIGLASYNSGTCQVSCSEAAVSLERTDEIPIQSLMDVPGDLLWVIQFLSVNKPHVVLIPSAGSKILLDVAYLCEVNVILTAPREFDEIRIWDLLGLLWSNITKLEWNSRICPHNHVMLMALSALLPYLQRNEYPIADIAELPPLGLLYVDQETLSSLQLSRTESHPMDFQGIGRSKEGLSLLSVVDRTCSVLGKTLLRQWFALPLRNKEELQSRYDVVSFFTNQENYDLMIQIRRSIRQLRFPGNIFTKIRASKHTIHDYESLLRSIKGFLRITSLLIPQAHVLPIFLRIVASCQNYQLEEMKNLIEEGITLSRDPDEALNKTYIHIRPGYDSTLDELRAHSNRLDELLTRAAQEESKNLPLNWGPCTVVCLFAPQWGYIINISHWSPSPEVAQAINVDLPSGWELILQTDDGPFFKTPITYQMDKDFGDLRSTIFEREGDIQRQIDKRLLELSPALIPVHHCAELDCLIGFSICALEGQWSCPEIVQEPGVLEIDRGIHPIFSRITSNQVVPYSLKIHNSNQRICIVTGSNGSGKSIFITAVAHTVFLAHIGSFVPCVRATIGLMDTLMSLHSLTSSINYNRNITSSSKELHSSFGNELVSMSRMLQRCYSRNKEDIAGASRSLLILDEFGKGTLSMDGAALLAASIRCFISLGDKRPILLLATHYTEAIQPMLIPREEILMLEMQTTLKTINYQRMKEHEEDEENEDEYDEFLLNNQQVVNSYRVMPLQRIEDIEYSQKKGTSSYALHFALQLSVPSFLLQRAWDIIITENI